MGNSRKIKLKDTHIKFLEKIPEKGMGYQLVDIEMKDGSELINRIILNSCLLVLNEDENIDASKIKKIKPHDKK